MTRHSPLASPSATIEALQAWGLSTDKSLGQHYLIDDGVVGKILRLAALEPGGQVLEVGPGIGTMTEALLLQGARVMALELDKRLEPVLADIAERYPGQFEYLIQDALQASPDQLPASFSLVANLPYSQAATIILDAFQRFAGLGSATVMVQREVAERIMASPNSKAYGAYSVKLALLASPAGSFSVSRQSFLPPPRVDSTVLRLERLPEGQGLPAERWPVAKLLVDAAFAERRKTLRNSLRSSLAGAGYQADAIDAALLAAGIDGSRRAEELSLDEFKRLIGQF